MKLINKNKLLEVIKKLKQNLSVSPIVVIEDVESLIESFEAKDIDIEKEFDKCCENYIFDDECEVYTARKFFEIGLKSKDVDMEKEFDKCCENHIFDDECEVYTAHKFFELGLKAQKGE